MPVDYVHQSHVLPYCASCCSPLTRAYEMVEEAYFVCPTCKSGLSIKLCDCAPRAPHPFDEDPITPTYLN